MMPEGHISLYRKRYCPKCTEIVHFSHDSTYAGCSVSPAFLVRRINSKTNDWFYGCPNFPKCKYTQKRPPTQREIDIKTKAWANSLGAENYNN